MNIEPSSVSSGLALSFAESPMFISPVTSDDSTNSSPNMSYDGILHVDTLVPGFWTQPVSTLRGGFRFLTLVSTSDGSISISNISCAISFMPHVENLREYSGYFYAEDPIFHDQNLLTKVRPNTLAASVICLKRSVFLALVCWRIYGPNKHSASEYWKASAVCSVSWWANFCYGCASRLLNHLHRQGGKTTQLLVSQVLLSLTEPSETGQFTVLVALGRIFSIESSAQGCLARYAFIISYNMVGTHLCWDTR